MRETTGNKRIAARILTAVFAVLAVLCILYGIMVGSVKSGTAFFGVWFVIAAGFVGLSCVTARGLWHRIPAVWRRVLLIGLCICLSVFLVGEGCILSGFGAAGKPGLDYIVVLGAQVREDGPGSILTRRLAVALTYLQDNPDTVCVVSGGQGSNEPWSEARGMADWLIARGIPAERIVLEDASFSTDQNLKKCRALIPNDATVGIVTNNFHIFRALKIAEKYGFRDVCGMSAGMSPWFIPHNMLREFFALCKFVLVSLFD